VGVGATGAAFLLRRDKGGLGNWGREQILLPNERQNGERFGEALTMRDEWIAIGAPGRKNGDGKQTGAVELFLLTGSANSPAEYSSQLAYDAFTRFGDALALGNRTLLVGDDQYDPTTSTVVVVSLMNHRERWGFDMFHDDVFNPALEATVWGDGADRDGDGAPTILEYLMGSSPVWGLDRPTYETAVLPGVTPGSKLLRLRFRKADWPAGAEYGLEPEWSFDLKTWYPSGEGPAPGMEKTIEQVVVVSGGIIFETWIIDAYLEVSDAEPQAYLRLAAHKR
jgi:hypothetical protein